MHARLRDILFNLPNGWNVCNVRFFPLDAVPSLGGVNLWLFLDPHVACQLVMAAVWSGSSPPPPPVLSWSVHLKFRLDFVIHLLCYRFIL